MNADTLLDELVRTIEELLLGGLTTASPATLQALGVSFQESSRHGFLRLGSTLRVAQEELGRFVRHEPEFARKRLFFFLNRAWLLAQALRSADAAGRERILGNVPGQPVDQLEVVVLGVGKKVSSSFCAFEFRLRSVGDGRPFVWSCIFPVKPGSDLPAETYLQLPQKQKFVAAVFLHAATVSITRANVSTDGAGLGRISLTESSTVVAGQPFADWQRYLEWTPATALARVRAHRAGPLDLEVELQEEIVLTDYRVSAAVERDESGPLAYPLTWRGIEWDAVVPRGSDGAALKAVFENLIKANPPPPLYGLMHYEIGRLIVQPLALFEIGKPPSYIQLSGQMSDRKSLLKAMKF